MGRKIMRVPVDFDWPLNKTWHGYLMPDRLSETGCPACDGSGMAPYARRWSDKWYGNAPFAPADTGSKPWTVLDQPVFEFARRNVERAPHFYGTGAQPTAREAQRLADLWNGMWMHHLDQADVDALIAADRLWDFTRQPRTDEQRALVAERRAQGHNSWLPHDNGYRPTPAEVNAWSLSGLGHDAINQGVCVEARCERDGKPHRCEACDGHGSTEAYPGQRAEREAWEPAEPPTGEGWQLWETVSEGSPISPVFPTRGGLVDWLCSPAYQWGISRPMSRDAAERFVGEGWAPTLIMQSPPPPVLAEEQS